VSIGFGNSIAIARAIAGFYCVWQGEEYHRGGTKDSEGVSGTGLFSCCFPSSSDWSYWRMMTADES
ncbi:MAG: hypothetical protein ACLFUS_15140, partial [Candidatus Sumerlaeia bacterium]